MQKYKISNTEKMMQKYNIPNTEKTMRKYRSSNPKYRKGSNTKSPKTKYCNVAALPCPPIQVLGGRLEHCFARFCTGLQGLQGFERLCTAYTALHGYSEIVWLSPLCVFKCSQMEHCFARFCTELNGFEQICTSFTALHGFERLSTTLRGFWRLWTVLHDFERLWTALHGFDLLCTALNRFSLLCAVCTQYVKMCYLSPLCVFKRTQMQHCLRGFAQYHIAMSRFTAQDHCVPLAQEVWYAPWCSGYYYFKTIGGRGSFAYIRSSLKENQKN